MQNNDKEEFEKRIRFEEGVKKDLEHLNNGFKSHLEDEVKYMEKFEKVQESHNNILYRLNDTEDELDETINTVKGHGDKFTSLNNWMIVFKMSLVAVLMISLLALTANPMVFKIIKPIVSFVLSKSF